MKKIILIFIIILLFIGLLAYFVFNKNQQSNNNNNFNISRISTQVNTEDNNNQNKSITSFSKELSAYSTVIKDDSPGRLTNIRLTCNILNNTIINPGDTFSFNNIVGQPTSARGYQEATVIINNKHEKGIGGGNCQVSSTLYNAVLSVPSLEVIERHEHGMDVTYVPERKRCCCFLWLFRFKI